METQILEQAAPRAMDEESWWRAVLERDARADGTFVYGVRSTMIFCRASCPSRRPAREQARFFDSPAAAIQAGFRACKRCRPEDEMSTPVARVRAACRLLEENFDAPLSLEELSRKVGGSASHLQRTFKQVTGVSPREYSDALRLGRFKTSLQNGETILNARLDSGFGSSRGVYERAPSQFGMTPASYRRGGKNARILFSVAPCSLGFLLVAATEKGICSVALGEAPEVLEVSLRREFFAAQIERDDNQLHDWIRAVLEILDGNSPRADLPRADLPLDVQATAFQCKVWQALRSIPVGQTQTYSQVARAIGQPSASRAVARACATNAVALLIPCHRVVREDGNLAGYRWGLERKEKLLAQEKCDADNGNA